MANIFALGLLNGMGSQFLKHREEQREFEERKRQEEREERLIAEEREYNELQNAIAQERAYRLEDYRAVQQQVGSLLAAERQDQLREDLQKKYPNAVIAPQTFSVQIPKEASTTPLLTMAQEVPNADKTATLFSYRDSQGKMRRFPAFDTDRIKEGSERARWVRETVNNLFPDDELEFHLSNHEKIRNGDPNAPQEDVISKIQSIMGTYSDDYSKALTVSQNNKTFIRSPLTFFGLDRRRPEVAEKFATTVVAPLIGVDAKKIRQIFKIPKNMPMTYDKFSESYIIDENMLKTHRYAIIPNPDPQAEDKHIYDPDIFARAREIASYSGRTVYNVISEIGSTKTGSLQSKEQAMKEFDRIAQIKAGIGNLPTNEFDLKNVLPSFKKNVYPKIRNLDADEAIETIRMAIPADTENVVTSWDVTEGTPKPTYASTTKNLFGVTPAEARFKYNNAENAVATMRAMLELRTKYEVKPGAVGVLRVSTAGFVDLLKDSAEFISKLGAPKNEQDAALRQEQAGALTKFASMFEENDTLELEGLQAQALFNMLSRQASYYIAGAVQGGATGRAVSDFDVRNNAESMQLQKVFSFGAGADANIEYLLTKMEREAALSQRYMNPQSFEDMQAALIYEQVTGGRMTFGSMLSGMDLEDTGNTPVNPFVGGAGEGDVQYDDFFGVQVPVIK